MDIKYVTKLWNSAGGTHSAQKFIERLMRLGCVEDPETRIAVLVKGFIHKNTDPRDREPISIKTIAEFIQQSLLIKINESRYPDIEELLETMGIKKVSTIVPDDSAETLYNYYIHYKPASSTDDDGLWFW
jgi:hypothetical protein